MATIELLVTRIKRRLARRNDTGIDNEIIDELLAAQERLEDSKTKPWFLVQRKEINKIGAHQTLDLKTDVTDFLRIYDDGGLEVKSLDANAAELYSPVERRDYEVLRSLELGLGTTDTLVTHYSVTAHIIEMRPKMIATRDYRLLCYARDPLKPGTDATTLWSQYQPDLLMSEAGMAMCMGVRDKDAMGFFTKTRSDAYMNMIVDEASREQAGTDPAMER